MTLMETTWTPPMSGSHRVDYIDGRAIIRGLELFCGYDPEIDDKTGDAKAKTLTREKLDEIVARTKQFIDRNQRPKLIVMHDKPDGNDVIETIGSIDNLRVFERKDGVCLILGDVEMSPVDFDHYLRQNRLPRRSAQIWKDEYMSEVALLGRQTPRRPVPDTWFSRDGEPEIFERVSDKYECDDKDKEDDDMAEDKKRDDNSRLAEENAALKAQIAELTAKASEAATQRDEFARSRDAMADSIQRLQSEMRQERFARVLDGMSRDGYSISDESRPVLLRQLVEAKTDDEAAALEKVWRSSFKRDPININLNARIPGAITGTTPTGDPTPEQSRAATEAAVEECVAKNIPLSSAVYQEVYQRNLKTVMGRG